MKKILGLDLGTTSIGWAVVNQAESADERSVIVKAGVRVNPLTSDEKDCFEKGKAITTNADRTLKRGARRNLQRYKLRRDNLIEILKREAWISDDTILSESGPKSTFETLKYRSDAATSEISLEALSKVLLMLNKKRGYKSNRKADKSEEGHLFDGLDVARSLYESDFTPAQHSLEQLKQGKPAPKEYYCSDLQRELDKIWQFQEQFYPEILTAEFRAQIANQGKAGVSRIFFAKYGIYTAENKGKDKKVTALKWRCESLDRKMEPEILAYVIADVKGEIQGTSGYLGAISDRSKKLYFGKQTVGQYLYSEIRKNPNTSLKNQVFYRQDYLDEFEKIWECQKRFHFQLTDALKREIRDVVIFYQRPLKSQKGLISYCEFEQREIQVEIDGKTKKKICGCRVAPRSSLLFQEFKKWCCLNNLTITDKSSSATYPLGEDELDALADELNVHGKLNASDTLKILGLRKTKYEMNLPSLEGNVTLATLFTKFIEVVNASGHGEYSLEKMSYSEAFSLIKNVFSGLGFKTDYLTFNSDLPKEEYEQQPIFKLWHLLYSYEGDKSRTGDESLIRKIGDLCGMPDEYAKIIAGAVFLDDYASLSHKAIRKILPYLKGGNTYSEACAFAGYNHSSYMTKEENENRKLKDRLDILPKGALRNPVVEKIINQMINVVNKASDEFGKPDEIHIEFARELKQNAEQREKTAKAIADRTKQNENIVKILQTEFGLSYVSKTDILRFRLYEELKGNGYKTLYSDKYIPRDRLFSRDIDIEHIIPQARLFDDSFANKTLEYRDVNMAKGRDTAVDFISRAYGAEAVERFRLRVDDLYKRGVIGRAKREKLLMRESDIPEDFVNRDLTNSQYIARKACEILGGFVKNIVPTNGLVTARLREDWQLVDILKEIDFPKYERAGLTRSVERGEGKIIPVIDDWSKRGDHRHHAMDAITIAFTRPAHIQILNSLNASTNNNPVYVALRDKEMSVVGTRRLFNPPIPISELRRESKEALESILVSIKAKNRVATRSVNVIKTKAGERRTSSLTPRGALHKEQVYGLRKEYKTNMVAIGGKMTSEMISKVASKRQREALEKRLAEYGGDPKKAFCGKNSPDKNPVVIDASRGITLSGKVKIVEFRNSFTIRKEIGPDLPLEKVADVRVKKLLEERLAEFGGDSKKAFTNLDENPIWFNKEKGIVLKRAAIRENLPLVAIHSKRANGNREILDKDGVPVPTDYVNLRNNHHVAIYKDADGNFQELVVSFFEALARVSDNLPAVNKEYRKEEGWEFVFSMKINEMFVFPNKETGFDPSEINLLDPGNSAAISPNLFRVQKLSSHAYYFRHHLETNIAEESTLKDVTWKRIKSLNSLRGTVKVRINNIGQIIEVGEYD